MNVTLKKGMKAGIFIAVVSAISILLTDLEFVNNRLIIPYLGSDIILSGIFIVAAWMLGYCVNLNIEYIRRLEDSVRKDSLTGLYNHGYFYTKLMEYEKISKLNSHKLSLIFLDIDDFKHYNDLNGHQQGDYALKHLANILIY